MVTSQDGIHFVRNTQTEISVAALFYTIKAIAEPSVAGVFLHSS